MSRFKAVVFDLDDTLFPGRQYTISGFRAAGNYLKRIFGVDLHADLLQAYEAGHGDDSVEYVLRRRFSMVEPLLLNRLEGIVRCHMPVLELYPDARTALALIGTRGFQVGIMADGPAHIQRNKISALNLKPLIHSMVMADDLGGREYWKPAPDPFHILALQLELEVHEMVYVGDDPNLDFLGPRRLGMGTIRIRRKDGIHARIEPPAPEAAPHISIPALDHMLTALDTLEQTFVATPEMSPLSP